MSDRSTPGPWHTGGVFNPNSPHPRQNVWGPTPPGMQSGNIVCHEARLDDARLIAAAPELLEALIAQEEAETFRSNECEECRDSAELDWATCEHCSERFGHAIDLRRAAIAKATGSAK